MFFLAGGYKYAQSGEGVCFMHVPKKFDMLPIQTGWYAGFADLERRSTDRVPFSNDGLRFAGATFDPSGIYRLNAVMDLFQQQGLDQGAISSYVQELQQHFLSCLDVSKCEQLRPGNLLSCSNCQQGHFFTLELESSDVAAKFASRLLEKEIMIDVRENRIRFGFGLYQDKNDIDELFLRINSN